MLRVIRSERTTPHLLLNVLILAVTVLKGHFIFSERYPARALLYRASLLAVKWRIFMRNFYKWRIPMYIGRNIHSQLSIYREIYLSVALLEKSIIVCIIKNTGFTIITTAISLFYFITAVLLSLLHASTEFPTRLKKYNLHKKINLFYSVTSTTREIIKMITLHVV